MQHIHLKSCSSTQGHLKDLLEAEPSTHGDVLVSTEQQTKGVGRHEKEWIDLKNNLAFSFTLKANQVPTLTPLEISLLIREFLTAKGFLVSLKWPNDLINSAGEKCGGILLNNINDSLLVGVGINWGQGDYAAIPRPHGIAPAGAINSNEKLSDAEKKDLPVQIYQFILKNRLDVKSIRSLWDKSCIHQNKEVLIVDGASEVCGVFKGIGEYGEALISNSEGLHKVFSGSLLPLNDV